MFRRTVSALTVITALAGTAFFPASALAKDNKNKNKHNQKHDSRFYDRTHRDYHAWNGDEDRLYRQYLGEQHHEYRPFARMNRQQQRAYWQWRHEHR